MRWNWPMPGSQRIFDDFVRGWIGTGGNYPYGVIHFAPNVDERCADLFDRAYSTLEMFRENGALADTVLRGFGNRWERPMSDIFCGYEENGTEALCPQAAKRNSRRQKPSGRKPTINRNDRRRFI